MSALRVTIALGQPGASLDAIRRATRLVGAAEFIESLPGGYHAALGERALRLSAGQRQKIVLARAFLRAPPLLLLDEPAAHLDPASARQLARVIETALAGRSVIVVSQGPRLGWRRRPRHPPRPGTAGATREARPPGRRVSRGAPVNHADVVPAVTAAGARGGPLLRMLRLARPLRGRLLLSVLAGAAATGCGVALLAVSAFLLARAAQHPSIVMIWMAVVAVRWLSGARPWRPAWAAD